MAAEPSVSPADTIRHLLEVAQDFLALEYPTGTDHLADAEANRLECALVAALDAFPALLAVGERDKAETERLREELGCSLGCKLPAGHPGDHDFDPDWPYEVTLRQEREAGERDRRQIARLAKALDRLAQEVENECRGRPSKQRLRHRATLARQDLAAVLADEEDAP